MRSRFTSLFAFIAATLIAAACARDELPTGASDGVRTAALGACDPTLAPPGYPGTPTPPGSLIDKSQHEGEIFGGIYEDEERVCAMPESDVIKLVPIGFSISSPFDSLLPADYNYRNMWEYWDRNPLLDGPCASDSLETEHASGTGVAEERHCVEGGGRQFMFTGPGPSGPRTFPVDYIGSAGAVLDATVGLNVVVASLTPTSSAMDLTIQSDIGSTNYAASEVARLHVDTTHAPTSAAFVHQASPTGDSTTTFRFRSYLSSSPWANNDASFTSVRGTYLARLYYRADPDTTWVPFTGYYDAYNEMHVLRQATFPGPTSCPGSRTYTIGLELLLPNEYPANAPAAGDSARRTITLTCSGGGGGSVTAPSNVGATSVSYTTATITWSTGHVGATSDVQVDDGGGWVTKATGVTAGLTSVGITGLTPGTTYDARVRHGSGGNYSSWTATTGGLFATTSVSAPTGISVTSVGTTTATVNWTNTVSVTGTTTEVETRPTAGGSWTAHGPASAGSTSQNLTGLSSGTAYDVRIRHSLAGVSSSWVDDEFETDEAPSLSITSFTGAVCDRYFSASKWRITWDLSWTISGSATGQTWELLESATSSTGDGFVVASNGSGLTGTSSEFLELEAPLTRYYWVRYVGVTGWVPFDTNPIEVTNCTLF